MCAEEFEEPTSCISSIVRPIRLHEPSIAQPTTQAPNEVSQLCPLVIRAQAKAFCRMPDLQSPPDVDCSTQLPTPFHRCQVPTLAANCLSLDQRKLGRRRRNWQTSAQVLHNKSNSSHWSKKQGEKYLSATGVQLLYNCSSVTRK